MGLLSFLRPRKGYRRPDDDSGYSTGSDQPVEICDSGDSGSDSGGDSGD